MKRKILLGLVVLSIFFSMITSTASNNYKANRTESKTKFIGIVIETSGQDIAVGGITYIVEVTEILESSSFLSLGEKIFVGIAFQDCVGSYDFFDIQDRVEVYGEVWGVVSVPTAYREVDICSSSEYYIRRIGEECDGGWNTSLVSLNAHEFTPNEIISGTLNYEIWNSSQCPSCIQQLVIGIDNNPVQCIYDGVPNVCLGKTHGTSAFSFPAPSSPGTYSIRISNAQEYSCEDAKKRYSEQNRTIIEIVVKENLCEKDSDNDGITDCDDQCPNQYGTTSNGCPQEECDNGIDDDKDKRVDCEDPDCKDSSLCKPDLSLGDVIVKPEYPENGSYADVMFTIKNVGNAIFPGGYIDVQLDFLDLEGSFVDGEIIHQLFFTEKLDHLDTDKDHLDPEKTKTIVLKVHIQSPCTILGLNRTIVIDHLSVKIWSPGDDISNNEERVRLDILPSNADIVNCFSLWFNYYLTTHGIKGNYDIFKVIPREKMGDLVSFSTILEVDLPNFVEALRAGDIEEAGKRFADLGLKLLYILTRLEEIPVISPAIYAINFVNSYLNGIKGCANIVTWTVQFIFSYISEIRKNGIYITAFWVGSKVDISIIDDQGRETSMTMEGEITNDIPGSEGLAVEDKKLILMPTISSTVIIKGRGKGEFNLTIIMGREESVDEAIYEGISTSLNSRAIVDIKGTMDYTMRLDKDGDGICEEKIKANKINGIEQDGREVTPESKEKTSGERTRIASDKFTLYSLIVALAAIIIALVYFHQRKREVPSYLTTRKIPSFEEKKLSNSKRKERQFKKAKKVIRSEKGGYTREIRVCEECPHYQPRDEKYGFCTMRNASITKNHVACGWVVED